MSQANPYESPSPQPPFQPQPPPAKAIYPTPHAVRTSMAWGESLQYLFRHPNWMLTLLYGTICQFIPIVGPLVFFGYQLEVEIDLTLSQGAAYRQFDFNRFTAYLKRGVFPFLVAMCVGFVLIPVFYVLMIVGFLAIAGLARAVGDAAPVVVIVGGVLGFLVYVALIIALHLILPPMMLRSGLTQQFGEAFNMAFIRDYISRVRNEMIISVFFQMLVGLGLTIAGLLLCFVGIYPAMIVMLMMQAHLQFQLYEIYRARGGETVPITSAD